LADAFGATLRMKITRLQDWGEDVEHHVLAPLDDQFHDDPLLIGAPGQGTMP
jgi:hypothetical protein